MAERLRQELAARGIAVVSGNARGIDAIGYQGAMAVNGRAIGVPVCLLSEGNKKL